MAKDTIVSTLSRLSGIKRVYENPPGSIQDCPCFMILPPSVENDVGMGYRWRKYEVPIDCLVSDQDKDQAAALLDDFRELLIPAFDAQVTLGGGATMAYVSRVGTGQNMEYPRGSGHFFAGFQATLFVEIKEGVDFAG